MTENSSVLEIAVIEGGRTDNGPEPAVTDPRAAVHPSAEIGPDCSIGPFAVVGPHVSLGSGCEVHAHAVIMGPTTLGDENVIHSFACIGGPPQDLRYQGERTELIVGNNNVFREHVTVNRGTSHGGGFTKIGNNNLLMAYCHVAHDCHIGNRVVMANHATIAGHTAVGHHAVFGGMVAVGTFLRIGESAMLAAGAMVEREVPPFCIVAGDRASLRAINRVGLDRRNFNPEARKQIRAIFRAIKEKGRPLDAIVAQFSKLDMLSPEAKRMLCFIEEVKRGLTR